MVKIIGEIGSNHMGDFEKGKQLIDLCKENGCKLAKFQLWKADDLYKGTKMYEKAKKYELGFDLAKRFFDYGKEIGIDVIFSVFYPEAITFCEAIGVKYYKISAAFSNNIDIVNGCLKTKKPVIVSFGGFFKTDADLFYNKRVIPLYTVPSYPPEFSEFNMAFLQENLKRKGGYSNHYTDMFFSKLATYLGAEWVELHVRLDKGCEDSPDIVCSITPSQLEEFVSWTKMLEE